jgi:hypothetical protein
MENDCIFYGHLEYFTAVWFLNGHFVNFMSIWYIPPIFGTFYHEKSGNPALVYRAYSLSSKTFLV